MHPGYPEKLLTCDFGKITVIRTLLFLFFYGYP